MRLIAPAANGNGQGSRTRADGSLLQCLSWCLVPTQTIALLWGCCWYRDQGRSSIYRVHPGSACSHGVLHLGPGKLPRAHRSLPPLVAQHKGSRSVEREALLQVLCYSGHRPAGRRSVFDFNCWGDLESSYRLFPRLTAVRATKRQVLSLRHTRGQSLAPEPMEAHPQQARRPACRRSSHRTPGRADRLGRHGQGQEQGQGQAR